MRGCGLERSVLGPHTANYRITVGIISPHIELATDGKEPALAPYSEAIADGAAQGVQRGLSGDGQTARRHEHQECRMGGDG